MDSTITMKAISSLFLYLCLVLCQDVSVAAVLSRTATQYNQNVTVTDPRVLPFIQQTGNLAGMANSSSVNPGVKGRSRRLYDLDNP